MDAESEALVKHIKDRIRKRKIKKYGIRCGIIVGILAVIMIPLAVMGNQALKDAKYMKQEATVMKNQLKVSVNCIKAKDYEGATTAIIQVDTIADALQNKLDEPLWKMAKGFPVVGNDLKSVDELLGMLGDASEGLIKPAITQLSENPMDNLKVGDGFNVGLLSSYVSFVEELEPKIDKLADQLDQITLSPMVMNLVDKDGKLAEYQEKMVDLMGEYRDLKGYIPAFKTVLGDGSDRFYLLPAQNSSEIRASGGFPGSIGSIQIQGGVLTIGEFASVYDIIPQEHQPDGIVISAEERTLFGQWYSERPKDSSFNPDFGRVGEIMAKAYEEQNGIAVDGVITMTPSMIQGVLDMFGEITLSDGTVMDGSNATQVLQHDLYFNYFGTSSGYDGTQADEITNLLFAETAKEAMGRFTSGFDLKLIKDYVALFNDGMKDRTIMMWMADAEEEAIMIESGCSGVLNTGSPNAVAGVYFSTPDPSKMGWFLNVDTEVSDGVKNDDGTISYQVKTIFNNVIEYAEIAQASGYILGTNQGSIEGYIYFVAPVNGTIGDFNASNGIPISEGTYDGLQLGYNHLILIAPNTPVEITYTVTTAAGVTDPLTISSTPTCQKYRAE